MQTQEVRPRSLYIGQAQFWIVPGDILADSIEDVDETEVGENKGGLKATTVKTAEEAKKYTLDDIAMPVIGSKITIPSTDQSGIYSLYVEVMKEDGITPDMFKHHDDMYPHPW